VKPSATAVFGAVLALLTAPVIAQTPTKHRAAVEQHSEHTMPFDMNRTMHIFESKPDGGMQTVMVHDGDPKQMALVRSHLRKEVPPLATAISRTPCRSTEPPCRALQSCARAQNAYASRMRLCQTARQSVIAPGIPSSSLRCTNGLPLSWTSTACMRCLTKLCTQDW